MIFLLHVESPEMPFCKTKLNGIFRVALKVISWASGVELNCTKKK